MTVFLDYQQTFPDSMEIRHIIVRFPGATQTIRYSLNEYYCADPECDCLLVRVEAVEVTSRLREATITFIFPSNKDARYPENPLLDPLSPQGPEAERILLVFKGIVLGERAYRERLYRHYDEIKAFVREKGDAALMEEIREDRLQGEALARLILKARPVWSGGSSAGGCKRRKKNKASRRKNRP